MGRSAAKMNVILQTIQYGIHQSARTLSHIGQWTIIGVVLAYSLGTPSFLQAKPTLDSMTKEQAVKLGEEFGIIVGEVDEEIRDFLGLERAEGVVVFEVIGGKPAALAGINPRALIKEINSVEINTLKDFGLALQKALPTENFSLATYEPADPNNQGISGGINFHFVRIEKS
jgi:membrane-associated protease RseP (regulator of RpoE activity)